MIFAAEMVYSLPYFSGRYFRPTFLTVFGITNTELGDMFALYGLLAMLSYLPGGYLADLFSTRKLITGSMITTALGGLYMAQIPDKFGMTLLFGYWGISSTLLLWAAIIKATRDWGGETTQGRAFGFMDGGRGFMAAFFGSIGTFILAFYLPSEMKIIDPEQRTNGMVAIIYLYTALTFTGGILVWFINPHSIQQTPRESKRISLLGIIDVIKDPKVWGKGMVVVTAYVAYKNLDNYSLYFVDIMGMTEVQAAWFTSNASYLRLVGAITAGILADKFKPSLVLKCMFLCLFICFFILSSLEFKTSTVLIIYGNIIVTYFGVFALRGIYFALLEESKVEPHKTGTSVGLISVIGYTPDIFFYPISARIISRSPGIEGYHNYFTFVAISVLAGMLVTWFLTRKISNSS